MNVLFGVPDVREMWYRNVKLVSVPSRYDCRMGSVDCRFSELDNIAVCKRYCVDERIWIRESQMPEYLAARLVEGVT